MYITDPLIKVVDYQDQNQIESTVPLTRNEIHLLSWVLIHTRMSFRKLAHLDLVSIDKHPWKHLEPMGAHKVHEQDQAKFDLSEPEPP